MRRDWSFNRQGSRGIEGRANTGFGRFSPLHQQSGSILDALTKGRVALSIVSQTPTLDAELLLCHLLGCKRSFLHAHAEVNLSDRHRRRYTTLLERRARGEPLAYVLGIKEFWSLPLRVTQDVLIPRPETELLVERALARIPAHQAMQIADLGTGSGAIALAIAHERPYSQVTATDISQTALAVASGNAARLGLFNVQFVAGDWFAPLHGRFHIIVSNPPYVEASDPHLQDMALQFEPHEALIGGADGLRNLDLIVQEARAFLHPGGWLIVEHGFEQGPAVRALFKRYGFDEVRSHLDLAQQVRATTGQWHQASWK
jgi:release factor glutamine methyltransferase